MGCIVIGVAGGIAAYKAVDVVRRLANRGFPVKVIMTENAARLVGPATFRAVSGNPVSLSLWSEGGSPVPHVSLAREADLVIVAPATANILAKMAHGIADDILSTTLLATTAPVLVAPAMNDRMFRHPATQSNIRELRRRGVRVTGPASGSLACGEEGEGRMAEPEEIVEEALHILGLQGNLAGVKVLVTAGGTREPIDPVRFIGNRSSGKMGYALAGAARGMGAEVVMVSAPTYLEDPQGVELVRVKTAAEMSSEVLKRAPACGAVIMAAAVADFTLREASGSKIRKEGRENVKLELEPTVDILEELGKVRAPGQVLVGFAAETEELRKNARAKLERKNVDLMVANDVSAEGTGFDSDYNRAVLLFRDGRERELDLMTKKDLAALVVREVSALLRGEE